MTVTVCLVAGDSMSSYPAPQSLWGWQGLGAVGIPVRLGPALPWQGVAQECVQGVPCEWDLSWEGEQRVVAWRGLVWRE